MNDLPKGWRDEVYLARLPGYDYIWIDALCIIQDSEYDWETEAVLMSEVYRNCHLNLAALSGETCHASLFHHRNPLLYIPCDLSSLFQGVSWPKNVALTLAAIRARDSVPDECQIRKIIRACGGNDYSEVMTNEPLNNRAWVLQERALSRRTLYFGKSGIFWDCLQVEIDGYANLQDRYVTPTFLVHERAWDEVNVKKALQRGRLGRGVALQGWYRLLALYSRSSFTKESDRLIAISALVKEVHKRTKFEYLAGLWKGIMVEDLLRCVRDRATRPGGEGIPSWA